MKIFLPSYLSLGSISLVYTLNKNRKIKPAYVPGLILLWPMAMTLSYTDMLKDMFPDCYD